MAHLAILPAAAGVHFIEMVIILKATRELALLWLLQAAAPPSSHRILTPVHGFMCIRACTTGKVYGRDLEQEWTEYLI